MSWPIDGYSPSLYKVMFLKVGEFGEFPLHIDFEFNIDNHHNQNTDDAVDYINDVADYIVSEFNSRFGSSFEIEEHKIYIGSKEAEEESE